MELRVVCVLLLKDLMGLGNGGVEKCKQRRVVAQGRILGVHQQCMESQLMSVSPCVQTVFCHRRKIQSKNERHQRHHKLQESRFSKVAWSTISKAALKSNEMSKIVLPSSA